MTRIFNRTQLYNGKVSYLIKYIEFLYHHFFKLISNILSSPGPMFISSWPKFLSFITSLSLSSRNSKYYLFIFPISFLSRSTSNFTVDISSWASSNSFFIFFICPVFYLRASLYLMSWVWISAPGCLARIFFSSKKSFSFYRIKFYLASTSSVLAIRRLH